MSEKPILFNQDMIHAILEGRKTQTRRIIKFENNESDKSECYVGRCTLGPGVFNLAAQRISKLPPYQIGDTLWVRETWQYIDFAEEKNGYVYRASQNGIDWEQNSDDWKWRPSIFMPRSAARIFLKVTDAKVQRIQDITKAEIFKEGTITGAIEESIHEMEDKARAYRDNNIPVYEPDYCREAFKNLWDSLYQGKGYGWDANPWVWVYSFERVKGDKNE